MKRPNRIVLVVCALLLAMGGGAGAVAQATPAGSEVSDLWLDISMGPPLVEWFNHTARPDDIARVDNAAQVALLDNITAGRKLVVFRSIADAERMVPALVGRVDIIGYNLEHGPATPAAEQADPVGSIRRMRELAQAHGMLLALGPDRRFALSDGVAMAPFVDIFVLQVQRVQTEPETVRDFVLPLAQQLRAANPALRLSVQIRTEGDVAALTELVASMKDSLQGISILTSPQTVEVAATLVEALRARQRAGPAAPVVGEVEAAPPDLPPAQVGDPVPPPAPRQEWPLALGGALVAGAVSGAVAGYLVCAARRRAAP